MSFGPLVPPEDAMPFKFGPLVPTHSEKREFTDFLPLNQIEPTDPHLDLAQAQGMQLTAISGQRLVPGRRLAGLLARGPAGREAAPASGTAPGPCSPAEAPSRTAHSLFRQLYCWNFPDGT